MLGQEISFTWCHIVANSFPGGTQAVDHMISQEAWNWATLITVYRAAYKICKHSLLQITLSAPHDIDMSYNSIKAARDEVTCPSSHSMPSSGLWSSQS